MQISREILQEIQKVQEDVASQLTSDNFPLSGQVYWTCVQCLAEAKLAELRGEI